MSATNQAPHRMTVAEFQEWEPPAGTEDRRWELVDGEPLCMAPPSVTHGMIQAQATFLLAQHLASHRPSCRVAVAPGVIPRARAHMNERVPDLAVTCEPPTQDGKFLDGAVLLLEILLPSNEAKTRANVWAYRTIASVSEILLLASTSISAELLRRNADGTWPEEPDELDDGADLHLACLGLTLPLRDFYRTTGLA